MPFLLLLSISTNPIFWWGHRARAKNLGVRRGTATHGSVHEDTPTNSQRHSEHATCVSPRILSFLVTSTNSQGHSGSVQLTKGTKVSTTQLASSYFTAKSAALMNRFRCNQQLMNNDNGCQSKVINVVGRSLPGELSFYTMVSDCQT